MQWTRTEKIKARAAVGASVRYGRMPPARSLKCVDCANPASQYDHYKGYAPENWLIVEPVCGSCNHKRSFRRGERVNLRNKGSTGLKLTKKQRRLISNATRSQWADPESRQRKIEGVKRNWIERKKRGSAEHGRVEKDYAVEAEG